MRLSTTAQRIGGYAALATLSLLASCAKLLDLQDRTLETEEGGNAGTGLTNGGRGGSSGTQTSGGRDGEGGGAAGDAGASGGRGGEPGTGGTDVGGLGGAVDGGGGQGAEGGETGTECVLATDCEQPTPPLDQCYELACDNGSCIARAKPDTAPCKSDGRAGLCSGAGSCIVCQRDTFICEGDNLRRCAFSQGAYEPAGQCAAGLCDDDAGLCLGCVPRSAYCSADYMTRIECSADGKGETQQPLTGEYCLGAGDLVDCVLDEHCPGTLLPDCMQKACVAGNTCGSRPKLLSTACTGGKCDGAGNCLICATDEYRCVGARLDRCNATRTGWQLASNCNSAALCSITAKQCLLCPPNGLTCSPTDPHARLRCSSDGLSSMTETDPNRFCTGQGTFVDCRAPGDCPQPTNPCMQATCTNDVCGTAPVSGTTACGGNGSCEPTGTCLGPPGNSCRNITLTCQGVSCCQNRLMQGGTFPMGRGAAGAPDACPSGVICTDSVERPEHSATVGDFYLDTFEVTVGRFRQFYINFEQIRPLPDNAGAHPRVANSGWQAAWNALLPATQNALLTGVQCSAAQTWPPIPNGPTTENRPMNCVTWYEAAAFCAWDGGRLPTEAEWEYAAAGGVSNNLYPWGGTAPVPTQANYLGNPNRDSILLVGSFPTGRNALGNYDLAGSMEEWQLDFGSTSWYTTGGNPCNNCANLTSASTRVTRGGSWATMETLLRVAARSGAAPGSRFDYRGFRCVHDRP